MEVPDFVVQVAMMDIEFEKLRGIWPNVTLNTTAAHEHVGEIEQKIVCVCVCVCVSGLRLKGEEL
jgi:hypothetical protein